MTVFSSILYFVIALAILIAVHEWGHFIAARLVGVKVLQFAIGFGPSLIAINGRKGTRYTLGLIPLGGFVKMLDEEEGPVSDDEKDMAFNQKPLWARVWVVIAGPLMNIVLAIAVLWIMFMIGIRGIAPVVGNVSEGSIAAKVGLKPQDELLALDGKAIHSWRDFQMAMLPRLGGSGTVSLTVKSRRSSSSDRRQLALPLSGWQIDHRQPDLLNSLGFQPFLPTIKPIIGQIIADSPSAGTNLQVGDRIISVDGQPITSWVQFLARVIRHPNTPLTLVVVRDGQQQHILLRTGERQWQGKTVGYLGIKVKPQPLGDGWLRMERYAPLAALQMAFSKTYTLTMNTFVMIGKFITGQVSLRNVSGPIGIAQGASLSAQGGLAHYLSFLALISISLAVLNILPVPMLDGGHLLFYLLEACLRRPLSLVIRQRMVMAGVVLLLGLTVLAFYNDIDRLTHRASTGTLK